MKKKYCRNCKVFAECEQLDVGLCLHCVENSNTSDLLGTIKSICEKIQSVPKEDCDAEIVSDYENVYKAIKNICTDAQFNTIQSFMGKPLVTLELAIGHLLSIYELNGGFYFTAEQAKKLVKKAGTVMKSISGILYWSKCVWILIG